MLYLGGIQGKEPGVPFQNPGFKGARAWVCGNRRGENYPPRPGAGVTNTEWISVDVGDLSWSCALG